MVDLGGFTKKPIIVKPPNIERADDFARWFSDLRYVSVSSRCAYLVKFLDSTRDTRELLREFFNYFPYLLVEIFGSSNEVKSGWIDECVELKDTDALTKLLDPQSPLFGIILTCLGDDKICYEFPVLRLPMPTQRQVKGGDSTLPSLYRQLKYMRGDSASLKDSPSIKLNIFEYYMFCFSYFVACVSSAVVKAAAKTVDATGFSLSLHTKPVLASDYKARLYQTLTGEYLNMFVPHSSGREERDAATTDAARTQARLRAELVVEVFTEFWLNQTAYTTDPRTPTDYTPPTRAALYCIKEFVRHLVEDPTLLPQHQRETQFRASGGSDRGSPATIQSSGLTPALRTVQRPLYRFLRVCFARPPHDSPALLSRMVGIWLAYIEPWRQVDKPYSTEDWSLFIVSNFLFYTVLLHDFLKLALNLNYTTSADDVRLLQDVLSAYEPPALVDHLKETERTSLRPDVMRFPGPAAQMAARLRAHMHVMEGTRFDYTPLFRGGKDGKVPVVVHLIHTLKAAAAASQDAAGRSQGGGAASFLFAPPKPESKPMTSELNANRDALSIIFSYYDESDTTAIRPSGPGSAETPETYGVRLTPRGKAQVLRGARMCSQMDVPIRGEVDTLPITSIENAFLVRQFFKLAQTLNRRFGLPREWSSIESQPLRLALTTTQMLNRYFGPQLDNPRYDTSDEAKFGFRFAASYATYVFLFFVLVLAYFVLSIVSSFFP